MRSLISFCKSWYVYHSFLRQKPNKNDIAGHILWQHLSDNHETTGRLVCIKYKFELFWLLLEVTEKKDFRKQFHRPQPHGGIYNYNLGKNNSGKCYSPPPVGTHCCVSEFLRVSWSKLKLNLLVNNDNERGGK